MERTVTFLQYLAQALYALVFVVVLVQAIRRPWRANVDIALFFGASAAVIAGTALVAFLGTADRPLAGAALGAFLMALPYLLLRLVRDFADVPTAITRLAEVGLALSVAGLLLLPGQLPIPATLLMVAYFVGLVLYATGAFVQQARHSTGVTRRRMQAVGLGSLFLGLDIAIAGVGAALPDQAPLWQSVSAVLGLLSGAAYFLGFATPVWLRRAWQEPELRRFLSIAARLPRLPETAQIVAEIERGATQSVGGTNANVGLWNPHTRHLRYFNKLADPAPVLTSGYAGLEWHENTWDVAPESLAAGQAFLQQQPVFIPDALRADPEHADLYRAAGAGAVLAAPITAGTERLGLLIVWAPRAPIFGDSDLQLVQLLADQAAVVLESRALIDEAARVRAREEATRLKDDFLSAAAHDLKTPLTTILAQAQLLQRRAGAENLNPSYRQGLDRLITEARRLRDLVLELLDASRAEIGRLTGPRTRVDLADLVREICVRNSTALHSCRAEAPEHLEAHHDPPRIRQLLDNLVENAVKYSPDGGEVVLRLVAESTSVHLSVTDRGIGIAPEDMPRLFDRFHRGSNVDDKRFSGMGLGLYICRAIVEEHGGRIWAESTVGQGTTFRVDLPLDARGVGAPFSAGGDAEAQRAQTAA